MCQITFLIVVSLSTKRGASLVTALAHLNLSSKYCVAFETLAGLDLGPTWQSSEAAEQPPI